MKSVIEKLIVKADSFLSKGNFLRALPLYQKILQHADASQGQLADAYSHAGECLINLGIFDEAEDYLRQALRIEPINALPHYLLGLALTKSSRISEAIFELRIAKKIMPDHSAVWRALGWALFVSGKTRLGERMMRKALTLNPKDIYTYCDLAVLYLNSFEDIKARRVLAEAEKVSPKNPILRDIRKVYRNFKVSNRKIETRTHF